MTDEFDPEEIPLDVERLMNDAMSAALRFEDADLFLRWMRDNIRSYEIGGFQPQADLFPVGGKDVVSRETDDLFAAMAVVLGRQLWNALPLPGNEFRPKPLPRPGRNDPCFCGSGRKFKQCCAQLPSFPELEPGEMWPLLVPHLTEAQRRGAIVSGRMPIEALGDMALDYLEDRNAPKKAADLLEPLFEGKGFRGTDERYDWLLNLLCNVYDRLGYTRKKAGLLQRVVEDAPRSPLRSGAWQRLAAMRIDEGDRQGAWEAFTRAQRDDPDSTSLGMLEIQMLLVEQRPDEARRRARFWLGKLSRLPDVDADLLSFYEAVAEDPHRAMLNLVTDVTEGTGEKFQRLMPVLEARSIPHYEAVVLADQEPTDVAGDMLRGLAEQLGGMGFGEKDIAEALEDLRERLDSEGMEYLGAGENGGEDGEAPQEYFAGTRMLVTPPTRLGELERQWRDIFPLQKPFSVSDASPSDFDPWDRDEEEEWVGWLEDHPEAWDSLDVLDDIATALMDHPQFGTPWLNAEALRPVLGRSAVILEQALAGHEDAVLEWGRIENRPALRSLSRLMGMALGAGDTEEAQGLAERMLALNPNDNHGVRSLVIKGYLAEGRNEDALALAARYADDMHPDLPYGKALALFRLGRADEADRLCAMLSIPCRRWRRCSRPNRRGGRSRIPTASPSAVTSRPGSIAMPCWSSGRPRPGRWIGCGG